MQWCKSKIFRGLRPLDPRQGLCPCTPPGALRRAPGPHPKSARAYALAMCAPRTCLPPQKNRHALTRSLCALRAHVCPPKKIGSRLRARYVRSAHMFAPKKKSARASRSLCALRAHVCPHNQSLPPTCPPHFLNPGAALVTGPVPATPAVRFCYERPNHRAGSAPEAGSSGTE